MELEKNYHWKIKKIKAETSGVQSLFLSCLEKRPEFVAGQYLTIKLPEQVPAEGKAYSIASNPAEPLVRITVRTIGTFSTSINKLAIGDEVTTSAPYGYFYPEPEDKTPLVLIAGGIGITPCFSISKDLLEKNDPRKIHLLYSNQTESDIVFVSEINELSSASDNFSVTHFITRETPHSTGYQTGRLSGPKIIELTSYLDQPE
ncbi:hypothetical protein KC872_04630, partial [Candidatus Kaiserbacteria bacterium]|nr:hypothetical protein [Candidatus Kaiserbacteria bacterium]